jgi:hypothetical protein
MGSCLTHVGHLYHGAAVRPVADAGSYTPAEVRRRFERRKSNEFGEINR